MNRQSTLVPLAFALVLAGGPAGAQDDLAERAARIAERTLIVDGHIDMPYQVYDDWADVSGSVPGNDFDAPRARQGGLDVPFMSIYLPPQTEASGEATTVANRLIDLVEAQVARAPDTFAIARTADEAERIAADGRIALALGMENGAAIAGDLELLAHFHDRGIRYITLTHAKANHIADSSYDPVAMWQGLSPFGEKLVTAMNRIGMMIDVSHVSDPAFFDIAAITTAPLVATHSSARRFTPGFERNASDEIIRAIAETGGVVMINFGSAFLTEEANAWQERYSAARANLMDQLGTEDRGHPRVEAFAAAYREQNPYPYASVADVADHIDHVIELVGIDHVGIGSDYDGVGDSLPDGLKDVSTYPALIEELLRRDYGEADIGKLLGENILRVWREVESIASR